MARFCSLFSSSKGNATYIGSAQSGILIDVGISYRRLLQALSLCGIEPEAIKGVFITHEHIDHIRGLAQLTKQRKLPVFASTGTLERLIATQSVHIDSKLYEMRGNPACIADMQVNAFATPHDCAESVGYTVHTADGHKLSVCTDLGEVTPCVEEHLRGSELVLLEANYDEAMLRANRLYPYPLKQRIASKHGHLSNPDSAAHLRKMVGEGTTRLVLGHLSEENNRPELAARQVVETLIGMECGRDYTLDVAPVATVGKMIVL